MEDKISMAEAARRTGLTAGRIRYYDQQFGKYLDIPRGAGGRRHFDEAALERLQTVLKLLKDDGLSIKQAQGFLGLSDEAAPAGAAPGARLEAMDQRIEALTEELTKVKQDHAELRAVVTRLVSMVAGLIEALDRGRP
ncbi:MAG: helix-turn-helix domain-containing protein [Proteobacteria bacterium]|nr:helix-turn-helix domain-containing protein [Pseudomonadota bacterium]MBU1740616.1 helix-turn-helix domain-containing protein [Pseudomonadota bacterium]